MVGQMMRYGSGHQKESESTRERIKAAAAEVFIEKGLDGARMQAIADRAGANKAMIYYYFHSKEALFEAVIRETFEELFSLFSDIQPGRSLDPKKLIPQIVHIHMQFLADHPYIPKIMVREMHSGNRIAEKVLRELFTKLKLGRYPNFIKVFEAGARAGKIRRVDPLQTIWNIVALNIFYFVARPFLTAGWPELFKGRSEEEILKAREKAVSDFILHALQA
jgi:TetR/AcrR family transcriptional regulator